MIWHGDVFVQFHLSKLLRQSQPPVRNHSSSIIQLHLGLDNRAVETSLDAGYKRSQSSSPAKSNHTPARELIDDDVFRDCKTRDVST